MPDYIASPTKVAVFSLVVAGFSMHSILTNGIDYVAQPRLTRKAFDEVLNYSGKGFECVFLLFLFFVVAFRFPSVWIGG